MEFVRSNKLALFVAVIVVLLVHVAAFLIGQQIGASLSSAQGSKSVSVDDYVYPAGKTKAEAPVGPAETRAPTADINPMTLIELRGNVELSQITVDTEFGVGLVTLKLTDAAFELYLDKVAELESSETKFTYDSLQIFEAEAKTLTDLPAVQSQLIELNNGTAPSTVFYQVRAVPAPVEGAPTSDNPGMAIVDPGPVEE